jgi:hypothetical protein
MKVLVAPTEDFIKRERTRLSLNATPGNNAVISVENSAGMLVNDYVVVGAEGSEQAEVCQITAVTNQSITVSVLKLVHYTYEPVVKYRYNKRKFYGCATISGTFLELTSYGSPAAIEVNDPQGTLLEYTGLEGYLYFKSTYYNSQTTEETGLVESTAVLADESVRYCSIYAIKKQAGLTNNPFITDGVIETYRKRAENEVNSYIYDHYILPLTNSSAVAEIPFVVENCTTLLAAGYMDYQEFGKDGEGINWLGEARALLKAIQKGTQQLIGSDNVELQRKTSTQGIQSYPGQVDNVNGPDRKFTMRQRF